MSSESSHSSNYRDFKRVKRHASPESDIEDWVVMDDIDRDPMDLLVAYDGTRRQVEPFRAASNSAEPIYRQIQPDVCRAVVIQASKSNPRQCSLHCGLQVSLTMGCRLATVIPAVGDLDQAHATDAMWASLSRQTVRKVLLPVAPGEEFHPTDLPALADIDAKQPWLPEDEEKGLKSILEGIKMINVSHEQCPPRWVPSCQEVRMKVDPATTLPLSLPFPMALPQSWPVEPLMSLPAVSSPDAAKLPTSVRTDVSSVKKVASRVERPLAPQAPSKSNEAEEESRKEEAVAAARPVAPRPAPRPDVRPKVYAPKDTEDNKEPAKFKFPLATQSSTSSCRKRLARNQASHCKAVENRRDQCVPKEYFHESGMLIVCPLCMSQEYNHMLRHLQTQHMPFMVRPDLACWEHRVSFESRADLEDHVNASHHEATKAYYGQSQQGEYIPYAFGIMYFIADVMRMPVEDLWTFARERGYGAPRQPQTSFLMATQVSVLETLHLGEQIDPCDIDCVGLSTPVAMLASPVTLACLMWHLDQASRLILRDQTPEAAPNGERVSQEKISQMLAEKVEVVYQDAHYHPHALVEHHGVDHESEVEIDTGYIPPHYESGQHLPDYTFQAEWKSIPAEETGTPFAVGVHPLEAGLPIDWDQFDDYAAQENCRAIGECGIDTSPKRVDVEQQKSVLAKQFRVARKYRLPIILHCRGKKNQVACQALAYNYMLDVARKILPSDYSMMCHCFLAGDKMLRRIRFFFPKMVFSISPKAFYHSSRYMEGTLKMIPTSNFVLETDSPHLTLLTKDDACPSMVVLVGREVGWALHWPEMIILRAATSTLQRFLHRS